MYGETNVKNPQAGYTMGVPEVLWTSVHVNKSKKKIYFC